jgi:peptidoglycan/xylan/chitin deacetylase (PgdA/CDA1 family)
MAGISRFLKRSGVPVLLYHHINHHEGDTVTVTPDVFAGQMRFLADAGFRAITLSELLEMIHGKQAVTDRSVVITFDDGWLDNYLFAYPVLMQYRFRAVSFLVTGRVAAAKGKTLNGAVPCHEEAKRLINSGEAGRVVLNWEIVRSMQRDGLMEFYSHTVTHRRCTGLDSAELDAELNDSRAVLEAELGKFCPYLCWPYGDYSDATVQAALAAGYRAMFTTAAGFVDRGSDPCRIKRIEVKNSVEWLQNTLLKGDL